MTTQRQFSSGGVIFQREDGEVQVALIARMGGKVWCLPKGHLDPGETSEEAALREVREETGLTGRVVGKLGEISYWFVQKKSAGRIFKKVVFFLMEKTGGDTSEHDFEVDDVRWFPVEEALKAMSYPSERTIVKKASQRIGNG